MKSTKYQLLKDDYDSLVKQLKLYRERIEWLEKELKGTERARDLYKRLLDKERK